MTSNLLLTLIGLQICMAAFDTVYHHELTERLAWRPSQKHELALHAARSLLYALLFTTLGLTEPHGLWAMVVIAVLATEVGITLSDFVEEDLSRKLPATERVLHTILAVNYGAILVLLVPILVDWAWQPTAIVPINYGYVSLLAPLASLGATTFGLREFFAARRAARLSHGCADMLVDEIAERRSFLITGATGFIGTRLVEALTAAGHDVTVLTHDPAKAARLRPPFRLITSLDDVPGDARIDVIVNLAGEPIANGLWTRKKRERILQSRLKMTEGVVRLIRWLERPPSLLINASAIGIYGACGDEKLDENAQPRASFGRDVCAAWEAAAREAENLGVRVVTLRIGLVLGIDGGMLGQMLPSYEFGLGARIGSGRQWMAWIERDDLIRMIARIVSDDAISGPVNGTAPEPVRNADFTRELARTLRRPAVLALPAWLLHNAAGDMADELLLTGRRVIPAKMLSRGFKFQHETLRGALAKILTDQSAETPRRIPAGRAATSLPN
jgi:uncharacterized protein (TIGR01777 family)